MKSGSKFSLFVVLAYLCIKHKDKVGMGLAEDEEMAGIEFVDIAGGYDPRQCQGRVLHMLCLGGGMSFSFGGVAYNVGAGDYVIMPDTSFASPISASADCNCMAMSLSEAFVASMALRSNYGVVGHLSLLQNPVMRLTEAQCRTCREVMGLLADRVGRPGHLFRKEMMGHLLMVHILDLYDIHARSNSLQQPMERAALIVRDFISMLYDGGPTARNGFAALPVGAIRVVAAVAPSVRNGGVWRGGQQFCVFIGWPWLGRHHNTQSSPKSSKPRLRA